MRYCVNMNKTTEGGRTFMFLGANIDAESVGKSYNIDYAKTYTASSVGTESVYRSVDAALRATKAAGIQGMSVSSACVMDSLNEVE